MRRIVFLVVVSCGHSGARNDESIAVAPKPVVAKPIEVIGEGNASGAGDVAPFEVAIGGSEFCVRIEGKVHCGRGDDSQPLATVAPLGTVEKIDDATSIALAADFGCLTTRRGTVHCWGSNMAGQLGARLAIDGSSEPVQVVGVANATRVFVGDDSACALTHGGVVQCWGLNLSGETGGATSWAPAARELVSPTVVPILRDVTTIAMSSRSTCAATKKGEVSCWGVSLLGEQQRAQGPNNEQPFRLTSLTKIEELSASSGAFCGVRSGEVFCFGSTYALVKTNEADRSAPARVPLRNVTKVRIGSSHACALTRDGRVWCWGFNANGELGREEPYDPNPAYDARDPEPVANIGNARDVVVSRSASCAVTGPEEAWCWGLFPYGVRQERTPVRLRVR